MVPLKLLPWEYGIRNLLRRPGRTALTLAAISTAIFLVLVVVGFVRGLESSLSASGDPNVVLVYSLGMGENLEYSSIPGSSADVLAASIAGIRRRYGAEYASPELCLAARMVAGDEQDESTGLIRGVTTAVLRVRRSVEIVEGAWPEAGEILVGRLAATKLGRSPEALGVGRSLEFEGRTWRISGRFAAPGAVAESEIWCRLEDLQSVLKRQDLSLVALTLAPGAPPADVDLFCKERLDLELQAMRETDYYASLNAHYRPVRMLAWVVVGLVAGAGVFAVLNTMYAAAVGRVRELATLQTIGFPRLALVLSLIQEATVLSLTGAILAAAVAVLLMDGVAIRFTMGAFQLRVDSVAVLIGCGMGLLLGWFGAVPPAMRGIRRPIAESLKAV